MKVFVGAMASFVFLFTVICCSPSSSKDDKVDNTLVLYYDYNANEFELAKIINDYRVIMGLNQLGIINHLSHMAGKHNDYMIENNVVNHALFYERSNNIIRVLGAIKVSENIAYNYKAPQATLNAWLNSSGHSATIEGDFTHYGISVTENPQTRKKYYTAIFIKK